MTKKLAISLLEGKDVNVNISRENEIERVLGLVLRGRDKEQGERCEPQVTKREREISSERIIKNQENYHQDWIE